MATALDDALIAARRAMLDTTRLTRLFSVLNEPGPLAQLLDRVLSTLSELFLADIVALVDPVHSGALAPLAALGIPEELASVPLFGDDPSRLAAAMDARSPILVDRAAEDPRGDPLFARLGAQAMVSVAVRGSDGPRGVLLLARCRPAPFAPADADLLSAMAHRIGLAVEQAEHGEQLEMVVRFGRHVARHLETSAICQEAARALPEIVGAQGAAAIVLAADGRVDCIARMGSHCPGEQRWCPLAERLVHDGRVAAGTPYTTPDAELHANQTRPAAAGECTARAALAVPIDHDGQMVGMLLAVRSNAVAFGPDAVRVATLVAGQASAALENARLYRAVRAELGERLRAEEERQRLEAELRRAQKAEAMAIFAGGIAHDYNNLLLAVIGNLELARLELAEGTRAYRETGHALDAAVQAADLTHKFMSVSTATGPSKALVPPCEVVQTAVRRATSGTPVVVDVRCAEALPMVPADRDQVEQALTALVVNACEATPAGGRVEVRAERRPPHDAVSDWVTISVRDQGHGIAPDVLPRIFDPYFTTKPRGPAKGTGLGLAIAQAVVARHGGRIEVDTTPGGGSTFAVWLPAAAGQVVVHGTRDAAPEPLPQEARRILVLEDDENVATLAVAMLERLGYTDVELAAEGGDAVELFVRARERGAPFTIAILDLTVRGGMGGRETLQRLLEIDPSLRAIVSSGYSTDPVVANYRAHGFCGSLPKPYRLEQLSRALDAALEV